MKVLNIGSGGRSIRKVLTDVEFPEDMVEHHLDQVGFAGCTYVCNAETCFLVPDGEYDLILASHLIEHVPEYEHRHMLKKWLTKLTNPGQIIILTPDMMAVAAVAAKRGLDAVLYKTDEGIPITCWDTFWGKADLIEDNPGMAHVSGYDQFSLKELLNEISNGRKHEVEIAAVNYQLVAILTIGNF